jgi:hypothetical protein
MLKYVKNMPYPITGYYGWTQALRKKLCASEHEVSTYIDENGGAVFIVKNADALGWILNELNEVYCQTIPNDDGTFNVIADLRD